jgi:hypothetical protein
MFGLFGHKKAEKDTIEVLKELKESVDVGSKVDMPSDDTVLNVPISFPVEVSKESVDVVITPKDSRDSKDDSKETKKEEIPPLTYKEMKYLKRSRYETDVMNNPKFKKAYLLKNIRTGQMAEIRAASSFHACNIIGWKANRVNVISEKEIKEAAPETTSSSNNPS